MPSGKGYWHFEQAQCQSRVECAVRILAFIGNDQLVRLTGMTITSNLEAVQSFGSTGTIMLPGSAVMLGGNRFALRSLNSSNTTLIANSSVIIGKMFPQDSSSTVTLGRGMHWEMTGDSNLTGNAGNISFTPLGRTAR